MGVMVGRGRVVRNKSGWGENIFEKKISGGKGGGFYSGAKSIWIRFFLHQIHLEIS